jgi:uncharacterized protein (DUF433 family)
MSILQTLHFVTPPDAAGERPHLERVDIVATPDTLGGKPRIDGTRVSVLQIAEMYEHERWSIQEIVEALGLTETQIYAALAYYYEHQEEIDRAIAEKDAWVEQIRAEREAFAGTPNVLDAVMTAAAVAAEFNVSPRTVRDAIEHGWIEAHKSAGTWLIRRADAEARWGGSTSQRE